jgi:hypothetical protein
LICRDANSNSNYGLYINARNGANAELIVKGKVTLNSNGLAGMYPYLFSDSKLDIAVLNDATLNLEQNRYGFFADVVSGAELNVEVKENGTFESCGNDDYDVYGTVTTASATATFSGTGYTCRSKLFINVGGTVVEPVCQDCPAIP